MSNTSIKHLYYVIIQFTVPYACAPKSNFQEIGCKICVPIMFEFWENGLAGSLNSSNTKKTSILCHYTINDALRMCLKSQFFTGLAIKFAFLQSLDFEKNWLRQLIELIEYIKKISILLSYNSRRPNHVLEKSIFRRRL